MALSIVFFPGLGKFELRGGSFTPLQYEGGIGCDGREYPIGDRGDFYICTRAGGIGGAVGRTLAVNDVLLCLASTGAGPGHIVGDNWTVLENPIEIGTGGGVVGEDITESQSWTTSEQAQGRENLGMIAPATSEVWLAVRTDGIAGDGTRESPHDASTAAEHDAILVSLPADTVINYGEGTFLTRGAPNAYHYMTPASKAAYVIPKNNWVIKGQPGGKTIIKLADSSLLSDAEVGTVTGVTHGVFTVTDLVNNVCTLAAHGLANGQIVTFTTTVAPGGAHRRHTVSSLRRDDEHVQVEGRFRSGCDGHYRCRHRAAHSYRNQLPLLALDCIRTGGG